MDFLTQHVESLIFVSQAPVTIKEMQNCLQETFETRFKAEQIEQALEEIRTRYTDDVHSFELVEIAEGFQFLTKGTYHKTIGILLKQSTRRRLSRAAMETLAIVAYKQPVTKSEMEKIRGVSCDYSIQKLLEKELVSITGRSEGPGRPLQYGTSEKFMDYFGLKSIKELPKLKDFKEPESAIGEQAPIEESVSVENKIKENEQ